MKINKITNLKKSSKFIKKLIKNNKINFKKIKSFN